MHGTEQGVIACCAPDRSIGTRDKRTRAMTKYSTDGEQVSNGATLLQAGCDERLLNILAVTNSSANNP